MSENADARRHRLLVNLVAGADGRSLEELAQEHRVDDRTIRRDVDALQDMLAAVGRVELRRGRLFATRGWRGPGYFGAHVDMNRGEKEAIANMVVDSIGDNVAITITAGSTTYYVARELRRRFVEDQRPRDLIAFTNSLPALMELLTGGISTGVIGEVYNPDDCAFHSPEYRSLFQPGVAIVGASGLVINPVTGAFELYSHRSEESFFLKQMLVHVPEIYVAASADKLGKRHPWPFTTGASLAGKRVKLFTSGITQDDRTTLQSLVKAAPRGGYQFSFHVADPLIKKTE